MYTITDNNNSNCCLCHYQVDYLKPLLSSMEHVVFKDNTICYLRLLRPYLITTFPQLKSINFDAITSEERSSANHLLKPFLCLNSLTSTSSSANLSAKTNNACGNNSGGKNNTSGPLASLSNTSPSVSLSNLFRNNSNNNSSNTANNGSYSCADISNFNSNHVDSTFIDETLSEIQLSNIARRQHLAGFDEVRPAQLRSLVV
jgi:hypothetical protein